jgi:selenocysteine-specific elongation factor
MQPTMKDKRPEPVDTAEHLTLGVIGHVDHGKTSLVKALTGMDTDRLEEERRRGMSIVLGFAWLGFDEGVIDIIDVPGHEQFVRTMIAGATGIDAVLLVVDAREGIKPQTVEHLAIIHLIGVRRGLIAVTKSDLVSDDERAALLHRLRTFLKGSCLEFAPAICTSVISGEGLPELGLALRRMLASRPASSPAGRRSYLPIDRVFSLPGHGTIVTGTLRAGILAVGDEMELMPDAVRTSVRQLQFHNRAVESAFPGQRVGVNLRHLKAADVARGDVLATVGLLRASCLLDAQITPAPGVDQPLADGQAVRLLFGATDVAATLRLLTHAALAPGDAGIAQLRTHRPVVAAAGEPFILRRDSPPATIGGGRFLDPVATRHRRSDAAAMKRLRVLAGGRRNDLLEERLRAARHVGIAAAELGAALDCPVAELAAVLGDIAAVQGDTVIYRPVLDALGQMLSAALAAYHGEWPARAGAPLAYCRASLAPGTSEQVFKAVLRSLVAAGEVEVGKGLARLRGHDPLEALAPHDRALALQIATRFREGGVTPPDVPGFTVDKRLAGLFHMLVDQGLLLLLQGQQPEQKVAFHRDAVAQALQRLRKAYPAPARFTVSDARALLGSTRKFTVPLLAYFDAVGHTRRCGDYRTLKPGPDSAD